MNLEIDFKTSATSTTPAELVNSPCQHNLTREGNQRRMKLTEIYSIQNLITLPWGFGVLGFWGDWGDWGQWGQWGEWGNRVNGVIKVNGVIGANGVNGVIGVNGMIGVNEVTGLNSGISSTLGPKKNNKKKNSTLL